MLTPYPRYVERASSCLILGLLMQRIPVKVLQREFCDNFWYCLKVAPSTALVAIEQLAINLDDHAGEAFGPTSIRLQYIRKVVNLSLVTSAEFANVFRRDMTGPSNVLMTHGRTALMKERNTAEGRLIYHPLHVTKHPQASMHERKNIVHGCKHFSFSEA